MTDEQAKEALAVLEKLCSHRNLLLTRAGVAGYRQTSDGQWVCDPASQAFNEACEVLRKVRGRI